MIIIVSGPLVIPVPNGQKLPRIHNNGPFLLRVLWVLPIIIRNLPLLQHKYKSISFFSEKDGLVTLWTTSVLEQRIWQNFKALNMRRFTQYLLIYRINQPRCRKWAHYETGQKSQGNETIRFNIFMSTKGVTL